MNLTHILKQILLEEKKKADRCKRIADRKFDKPSAYKSGAIVRCRQGKIWKDIKEEILTELDVSKYIKSWIDTKTLKKSENFPESIFLYLKKNGYINKGEIYRILTLDPLVVIIKQNTEYIDLDKFLKDNQDIEPYDDLYSTYQDEKEVVARLDPNFSFEDIHYASPIGLNMNIFLKNLDKNKLKNDILKKDQGKLLSFTKDKNAANDIFYTAINHLEDDEFLNENKEEFQNRALEKINKVGKFNNLPDIDKLALLGGSNDEKLKKLNLRNIYKENGGTFGKLEIKVKVKDIKDQLIKHKFSQEFAGKEGYLFPYINYDDNNQPYVTVRFDEFINNPDLKGGGMYEERPIMLANLYPIDYDKIKSDFVQYQNKIDFERSEFLKSFGLDDIDENIQKQLNLLTEKQKETLRTWFKRKGAPGKTGGWVDCNTCREVDGKTKCKPCGRQKGEKRAKYPSCRPTPAACKDKGKGKTWGKTK